MDDNKEEKKHGTFSDVIGALVSSFAQARSVADVQTLRIANHYRQNEYLKGLPVPRLRLQRVSISLPMIVTGMVEEKDAVAQDAHSLARALEIKFVEKLLESGASFSRVEQSEAASEEEKQYDTFYNNLFQEMDVETNQGKIKDDFSKTLIREFEKELLVVRLNHGPHEPSDALISEAAADSVEKTINGVIRELLFKALKQHLTGEESAHVQNAPKPLPRRRSTRKTPQQTVETVKFDPERARRSINEKALPSKWMRNIIHKMRFEAVQQAIKEQSVASDLLITVNTDDIKNSGGGPNTVTRFNMVLLEEGLEWVTETGEDGEESTKLMRE